MKTALNAAVALTLCAVLLAGKASAESEAAPAPAPESAPQPPPGILLTPPRAPPPDTQQSCPATGQKLELVLTHIVRKLGRSQPGRRGSPVAGSGRVSFAYPRRQLRELGAFALRPALLARAKTGCVFWR